ncbi:reverse transcriptase domain-containing protein [Tanacetum coccineum]
MGDENPIRTLGDYFKPSHEGYRNTIELPVGNNVVPLRFDTIRLVQNGCSFHGLRSEDPNQNLKDFLKLVDSLDLDGKNREKMRLRLFRFSLRDQASNWLERLPAGSITTWEENLYPKHGLNDPRDFAKPVKAIALPQDVPSTSDCCLIELETQVQRLMEAHLAPTQPTQVNKITTSCEICSGPHDTQYCMEDPEQAFVEYASSRTDEAGGNGYIKNGQQRWEEREKAKPNAYSSLMGQPITGDDTNRHIDKFLEVTKMLPALHFDISFADALLRMPKFASTFKSLLSNKEKLFELANTPLNENCSAELLKKFPKKHGDSGKFLIPCDFPKLDECLALVDLGTSINLIPLSVWKKLSLSELTLTRMTLELANRSVAYPVGVAEYVFVKVGKFHFPADFVIVDYHVDPRVPLILGRPFLRTARALIDVHGEELTLRVNDEAITFKVRHTSRYSRNYDDESVNQINVIDVACEEYAQEVLGFLDSSTRGNYTPSEPIIASSSPSFTPFEGGDFILEEIKTFLHISDELSNLDDDYYDMDGYILYLEKLLNEDPSSNLTPMKNEDLKQVDVTMTKPSIEEPSELELKDLPPHLEYTFLEGTDKLPVIISKELKR